MYLVMNLTLETEFYALDHLSLFNRTNDFHSVGHSGFTTGKGVHDALFSPWQKVQSGFWKSN
jgi:hypothetical protein